MKPQSAPINNRW